MKRRSGWIAVALGWAVYSCGVGTAGSQVPAIMNYQGRLLDGTNLVNGDVGLSLRLYATVTGGVLLYEDSNTVTVVDGLYATYLGDDTVVGSLGDVLASNSSLWLEIAVDGETLVPREQLAAVPYALLAAQLAPGAAMPFVRKDGDVMTGPLTNLQNITAGQFLNAFNTVTGVHADALGGYGNSAYGESAVVGGGYNNVASNDYSAVAGGQGNVADGYLGFIGGGYENSAIGQASAIVGGDGNRAEGAAAFVGGGRLNQASGYRATVGGGYQNEAGNNYATVGGGCLNDALGYAAAIPGGYGNSATGTYAFAAGYRALADHDGCFVWGDMTEADIASTNGNSVTFRAYGGFRVFSADQVGVILPPGSGSWTTLSDVRAKENIRPVDGQAILEKILALPVSEWNYTTQDDSVRHLGPMAGDFHAAFGLGEDATGISSVDADGVALAAIQTLVRQQAELKAEIATLKARLESVEAR